MKLDINDKLTLIMLISSLGILLVILFGDLKERLFSSLLAFFLGINLIALILKEPIEKLLNEINELKQQNSKPKIELIYNRGKL